jgi:hypothetical protein
LLFSFCVGCLDTETVSGLRGLYFHCTCMYTYYGRVFRTWYSGSDLPQLYSVASENQRCASAFIFTAADHILRLFYSFIPTFLEAFSLAVCPYAEATRETLKVFLWHFNTGDFQYNYSLLLPAFVKIGQKLRKHYMKTYMLLY